MNVVYAILVLVAIIVIVIVWQKVKSASRKAFNQKVLYRSESKEGQQLVTEPITIETSASVEDVLREVTARVTVAEGKPGLKGVLYESNRTAKAIAYTHGNKFSDNFVATVSLAERDGKTIGEFEFHSWNEVDGMVSSQDAMRKLRKQVEDALAAVDTSDRATEVSEDEKQPELISSKEKQNG